MEKNKIIILLMGLLWIVLWGCSEPTPVTNQDNHQTEKTEIEKTDDSGIINDTETSDAENDESTDNSIEIEEDSSKDNKTDISDLKNENDSFDSDKTELENTEDDVSVPENSDDSVDHELPDSTEEDISEIIVEPEAVTFSIEGDVEYEAQLILSCSTEKTEIFYSYEEFLAEDYISQKKYTEPLAITKDCNVYAVSVYKTVTSNITSACFTITNLETLCYGEATVFKDYECTSISIPSNQKSDENNNLSVIMGKDVKITVDKNTATQPKNWIDSWRFYYTAAEDKTSNTITFTSETKKIKKIIFESTNYTQGKFTVNDGDFDAKKGIWYGLSDSLVFTPTANAQLKKITVIYSTE